MTSVREEIARAIVSRAYSRRRNSIPTWCETAADAVIAALSTPEAVVRMREAISALGLQLKGRRLDNFDCEQVAAACRRALLGTGEAP